MNRAKKGQSVFNVERVSFVIRVTFSDSSPPPPRGGGLSDSLRHSRSLVSSTNVYTYHFSRFHSSLLLALSRDAVASWWGSECDRGCSARGPTRGLDGSGSATPRGSSLASLGNPRCAILFSTDFGSSSLPRASWHGAALFTRFLFRSSRLLSVPARLPERRSSSLPPATISTPRRPSSRAYIPPLPFCKTAPCKTADPIMRIDRSIVHEILRKIPVIFIISSIGLCHWRCVIVRLFSDRHVWRQTVISFSFLFFSFSFSFERRSNTDLDETIGE